MRLRPGVLLIDDDPLFRKALEAVLPRMGLDVRAISDPAQFIPAARQFRSDLYLIDLQLGEFSGFDLIRDLRAEDPKAVILVISGARDRESVVHALELGANDFILKPLDRTLLASKLSRYVDTDILKDQRSLAVDPPEGRAPGKLAFETAIVALDELGIGLESRHLIPKGTVLKLKTDLLKEIGTPLTETLVTVVSTSFDSEKGIYGAYAEFDEPPAVLTDALRRWLGQKTPPPQS